MSASELTGGINIRTSRAYTKKSNPYLSDPLEYVTVVEYQGMLLTGRYLKVKIKFRCTAEK
jgi:hypothetical protein